MSAQSPRVAIGVLLHNHASHLREALESLVIQTHQDFGLVLVDDASTDETPALAREYAALDPRISYHRNESRLGYLANWDRALELALRLHPQAQYYACASDHDVWHPRWLAVLLAEMERHPEAVLAYPWNLRITGTGEEFRPPWSFDTGNAVKPLARFRLTFRGMSAGNMVYGLFRVNELLASGGFRRVLMPDRLLLCELALRGPLRQVREILWFRRYGGLLDLERQQTAFFPGGAPGYTRVPWWITHVAALGWQLGVRGAGRPGVSRWTGIRAACSYLALSLDRELWRSVKLLRKALRRALDRAAKVRRKRRLAGAAMAKP
ncbi:MAG TPA: glycosyltransferase family A protein [Planctomycetota bacterium]|nr:glycosyltransferase family A protein [Planctomycetota bacterium]